MDWTGRLDLALKARGVVKSYALAVELGVDESAISRWRRGRSISLDNAVNLCRTLDVSLDWLLTGRGHIDAHQDRRTRLEGMSHDLLAELPEADAAEALGVLIGLIRVIKAARNRG